jgi:ParB family transcriptional regulator, chromosome partitioning protein
MAISAANSELKLIPTDRIDRNEHNPRIIFRQREMDALVDSISEYGIQVPITVYRAGHRFVLIDGERRWRCALKLNLKTIPGLVQEPPSKLTNILLMFNIHALREQWDLLTIALKLGEVIALIEAEDGKPTERELSRRTGLSRAVLRRCRLLLGLPERYRQIILGELNKPKQSQKLTEDFFIEMERALKTVERRMPETIVDKDRVREVLIEKFQHGVIVNRVQFRNVAKIARATNVASDTKQAQRALGKLFSKNSYSIEQAYSDSVSEAYSERELITGLDAVLDRLRSLAPEDIDLTLQERLSELMLEAARLLER